MMAKQYASLLYAISKFKISKFSDITSDVQYINDEIKNGEERDGAGHAKEVKVILFA